MVSYGPSNPRPWLDPVSGGFGLDDSLEAHDRFKLFRQREYIGWFPNRPLYRWMKKYPRDYIWSNAHFAERSRWVERGHRQLSFFNTVKEYRDYMWPMRFTHHVFGEVNAFGIKVLIPIRRAVRSWVRRIRELRINERKYAPGGEGYYRAKRSFGVMSGTERATRAFTRRLK